MRSRRFKSWNSKCCSSGTKPALTNEDVALLSPSNDTVSVWSSHKSDFRRVNTAAPCWQVSALRECESPSEFLAFLGPYLDASVRRLISMVVPGQKPTLSKLFGLTRVPSSLSNRTMPREE